MAKRRTPEKTKRQNAQAASQTRRKRKRRGKRTLHYLLLLLFVLAAGIILSLTVFFKIEDVRVVGLDKYPEDEVIAATGIEIGENLLRLKTGEIEELLLGEYPYIESVEVKRRFPPAVELVVTQAEPAGAVADGADIVLITREGKILERGDILIPAELPVIRGLELAGMQPGEYLEGENHEKLVMLQYLFDAAEKTDFGLITNVDVSDRLNMRMVYEARLVLVLGSEADMEYKLTFIQRVIDDLGDEVQARIDASNIAGKRVLVKFGKVENGEFTAAGSSVYDQIYNVDALEDTLPSAPSAAGGTGTAQDGGGGTAPPAENGGDEQPAEDEPEVDEPEEPEPEPEPDATTAGAQEPEESSEWEGIDVNIGQELEE